KVITRAASSPSKGGSCIKVALSAWRRRASTQARTASLLRGRLTELAPDQAREMHAQSAQIAKLDGDVLVQRQEKTARVRPGDHRLPCVQALPSATQKFDQPVQR